ncbi:MAG: Succinate dehydrogenase cytochrome b558 subunit [Chlamydiae bacterium]|nr:Succinate dehydrogenase cytochrome b558 subunit [Chlamydiota bacterium]
MTTPVSEKHFESDETRRLPKPFLLRRLHSLLGIWLAVYLSEHLYVNSQMALYVEDDGQGFISAVNKIHAIPYLKLVEILFLGLPFLIHGIWGIQYALRAKLNSYKSDGTRPSLPQYKRNRAYSWQRITSWILLIAITGHVIQMRFLDYPSSSQDGEKKSYMVRLVPDPSLYLVAQKIDASLYTKQEIEEKGRGLSEEEKSLSEMEGESYYTLLDRIDEGKEWMEAARKKRLKKGKVLAVSPNAGGAFFLSVRETFKSPLMVILYSIFVVTAAYHGFNGLWTFCISWGLTLTRRSQRVARFITTLLMGVVMLMGLVSIWGTYYTIQFT